MNITAFAERHHVRTRHDECGDTVIFGKLWKKQPVTKFNRERNPERMDNLKYGHLIYEYGDGRFGLFFMPEMDYGSEIGGSGKTAKLGFAKKKLLAAGFTIQHEGDAECIALFDPENAVQAAVALELARVKRRRVMSPEQRIAAAERLAVVRKAA